MRLLKKIVGLNIFIFVIVLFKWWHDTFTFKLNRVQINQEQTSQQTIRILQLTDIHGKMSSQSIKRISEIIKKEQPDLITLTGDLIDRKTKRFDNVLDCIDELIAFDLPIFFVSGNHEHGNKRGDHFVTSLKEKGIYIIDNESHAMPLKTGELDVIGINDISTGHADVARAMRNVNGKRKRLLLSHCPNIVFSHPELAVDLILSGHTHGGQVRLPLIGALISPNQGAFPTYDKGTFTFTDKVLYVCSGFGTSQLRLRLFNQSQISLIDWHI